MSIRSVFLVSVLFSSMAVANFTRMFSFTDLALNDSKLMSQVPVRVDSRFQADYFNLSQFNVSCNKTPSNKLENRTQQLEEQVGRFVGHLKMFIKETSFTLLKFEPEIEELEQRLYKLHAGVQLEIHSPGLQQQFMFATHMFLVMVESAKAMEHLKSYPHTGYPLVYKVLDLNVRVLALYDARGRLDTHIDGYINDLSRLQASLNFWTERFENLVLSSPIVSEIFQKHSKRLQETFKYLKSQVP